MAINSRFYKGSDSNDGAREEKTGARGIRCYFGQLSWPWNIAARTVKDACSEMQQ
jgi:hypothetical protein